MSTASFSPPLHPAPDIAPEQLTPMFAQYLEIKKQHEDALLFYRMGDFYELFFDDAVVAAKALQITLTSRNPNAENPVPMCGVPHHSYASYLRQLREMGFSVAICEQVEDPKAAKGLVKRDVVRVETPGATLDDEGLTAKGNNFLGAVYWNAEAERGGFAWLDYSTGDWSGLQTRREADLWQWVGKLQPRELLIPDLPEASAKCKGLNIDGLITLPLPVRAYFDRKGAEERILECQGVRELATLGLENKDELVRACGALLAYLLRTQKRKLTHLRPFVLLRLSKHLIIDEITERNLEIFKRLDGKKGPGTLWHVLDETVTPMGGRLLAERLRHPWREAERIRESADVVQFFYDAAHKRLALRAALDGVYDLERLATKVDLDRVSPKDMLALAKSLDALENVREALEAAPPGSYASQADVSGFPTAVASLYRNWDSLDDLADLLRTALADPPPPVITDGGLFKQGWRPELDELIDLVEHGESRMQELLAREQQALGLTRLKLGYNRVFGHYFELPKSMTEQAPAHFIRRQTVANAERYVSPELKELEDRLLAAADERKKLEYELFAELRKRVAAQLPRIRFMAGVLAGLDFWQGLSEAARKRGWNRPELAEGADLALVQARHPVVEAMPGGDSFVPNDLYMDGKRRLILITGPNMAGKSTVLRQTAIIVILAQIGSFVPAAKARIGLVDRVFSRVGASDNLAQGQSTFMVEMMESARILRQATKKSLVILDEIGRGTSTFDGLSLAWAVAEDLVRRAAGSIRTLFATHYHELTALEGRLLGLHNMNIAVTEHGGDIVFTRRLVPGPSDRSYGIEVARLAGVPQPVVQRARAILAMLENSRALVRENSREAIKQLLPGVTTPEKGPEHPAPLPPVREKSAHPLCTILRDLDTDHLTPMRALALVNEWKQLFGDNSI
ncbi:DNA mismatch repair protein MutS [Desulfovibrio sp. OttesenSCG-928-M14]|nr:DNA mismatch repair protein MutS [Desulfovibrio sp. OttesenSCG-928-M14]